MPPFALRSFGIATLACAVLFIAYQWYALIWGRPHVPVVEIGDACVLPNGLARNEDRDMLTCKDGRYAKLRGAMIMSKRGADCKSGERDPASAISGEPLICVEGRYELAAFSSAKISAGIVGYSLDEHGCLYRVAVNKKQAAELTAIIDSDGKPECRPPAANG